MPGDQRREFQLWLEATAAMAKTHAGRALERYPAPLLAAEGTGWRIMTRRYGMADQDREDDHRLFAPGVRRAGVKSGDR